MINELYPLSKAMQDAGITVESWHPEYEGLPKIKSDAPCVRIILSGNQVVRFESVDKSLGKKLRKYGNNQASFPAMNLAPLYRLENEDDKKILSSLLDKAGEKISIQQIKQLCTCNNWGRNFSEKYKRCMRNTPQKLEMLLQGKAVCPAVSKLIQVIQPFTDPQILHAELERIAFDNLEKRKDIRLTTQILFYNCKNNAKDDYGSLSVILDSEELEAEGIPAASVQFTEELNQALFAADVQEGCREKTTGLDAFDISYVPLAKPMPTVKLSGGFKVSLRTMFKGKPCQTRYGRIEDATYPISYEMRMQIKNALEWLSKEELQDTTWVKTGDKEILFVYPSRIPKAHMGFTRMFKAPQNAKQMARFETEAKLFAEYVVKTKITDPERYPESIQMFMLRKLDKARTKVIYTRCASPDEIVRHSEEWQDAAKNLPSFYVKNLYVPFPLEIANIMNRTWKQDGSQATDKFKPISSYHGMELLFGVSKEVLEADLRFVNSHSGNMALYAGKVLNTVTASKTKEQFYFKLHDALVLMGMLLYWLGSRKENYMNEYPYLLGQMLKVSDGLHELYCYEERNKQIPPQLVGNSMYVAASEMPMQTLAQLGRRMMPYITWAKKNPNAQIKGKRKGKDGEEVEFSGPSAGYLLSVYRQIADKLEPVLDKKTRFDDCEKAQLFIGYLASYPKNENGNKNNENDMLGGSVNE